MTNRDPIYEYRVVCPDGECRVGSMVRHYNRDHVHSWTLVLANDERGAHSHRTQCPGEHRVQERRLGPWVDSLAPKEEEEG